MVQLSNQS